MILLRNIWGLFTEHHLNKPLKSFLSDTCMQSNSLRQMIVHVFVRKHIFRIVTIFKYHQHNGYIFHNWRSVYVADLSCWIRVCMHYWSRLILLWFEHIWSTSDFVQFDRFMKGKQHCAYVTNLLIGISIAHLNHLLSTGDS